MFKLLQCNSLPQSNKYKLKLQHNLPLNSLKLQLRRHQLNLQQPQEQLQPRQLQLRTSQPKNPKQMQHQHRQRPHKLHQHKQRPHRLRQLRLHQLKQLLEPKKRPRLDLTSRRLSRSPASQFSLLAPSHCFQSA